MLVITKYSLLHIANTFNIAPLFSDLNVGYKKDKLKTRTVEINNIGLMIKTASHPDISF